MQTFICHTSCFYNVRESQSFLHNTLREQYSQWFRNCIWLYARLRFADLKFERESLFWEFDSVFVPFHRSTLSFSCICSVLSHTPPTADILLFTHFCISLCEVLLIHNSCLLHDYTYLILFLFLLLFMNFSFFNYDFNCIYNFKCSCFIIGKLDTRVNKKKTSITVIASFST